MFAFFLNGSFFSFWQNRPGQIFFDLTADGLGWDRSQVSLFFYAGVQSVPEIFRFDENKNLIIQEQQVIDGEIQEETLVDIQTVTAEVYVQNGERIIPC